MSTTTPLRAPTVTHNTSTRIAKCPHKHIPAPHNRDPFGDGPNVDPPGYPTSLMANYDGAQPLTPGVGRPQESTVQIRFGLPGPTASVLNVRYVIPSA